MRKIIFLIILFLIAEIHTKAQDISKLFNQVDNSVVTIQVIESKTVGEGKTDKVSYGALGTGVLINKEGKILTAAHVVNNADQIMVIFKDGQTLQAKVESLSRKADIAVIKTQGIINNPQIAKLGNSDETKIGDKIIIIGNPMGLYHSLSVGYISRKETSIQSTSALKSMEIFQTDAAINTGNSGGPMFNLNGEVIGIVSSILSRSGGFEGIGFVATINIIKDLLLDNSNNWIGVDAFYLHGKIAFAFNIAQGGGVLIENVSKNSPAYYMGLKGGNLISVINKQEVVIGGDIVLAIDNYKFDTPKNTEKAINYLNTLEKGTNYTLKILRAGEIIELKWIIKGTSENN